MRSQYVHCVDTESTGSLIKTRASKEVSVSLMNVLPYDTWRHEELPIFIRSSAQNEAVDGVNEDQMALIYHDHGASWRDTWMHRTHLED